MSHSSEHLYDEQGPAWVALEGRRARPLGRHQRAFVLLVCGLLGAWLVQGAATSYLHEVVERPNVHLAEKITDPAPLAFYRRRLIADVIDPLTVQLQRIEELRREGLSPHFQQRKLDIDSELEKIMNSETLLSSPQPYQRQEREIQLVISLSWESLQALEQSLLAGSEPGAESSSNYSAQWFKTAERQLKETSDFLRAYHKPI